MQPRHHVPVPPSEDDRATSAAAGFVHRATVCASPDDLARHAVREIRAGLGAGRTTLAVLRLDVEVDVRLRLGPQVNAVRFLRHHEIYTPEVVAVHEQYLGALRDLCARKGPVTTVAQHEPADDDDAGGTRCLEREVLVDLDFVGLPVHQHCLYPAYRSPRMVGVAYRTHPVVTGPDGPRPNPRYRSPAVLLSSHPTLSHLDRDAVVRDVRPDHDPGLRRWLTTSATSAGLAGDRAADFSRAAHEALRLAARHPPRDENSGEAPGGGGTVRVRVHRTESGVACDVDTAPFPAIRRRRLPADPRLSFLWMTANNTGGVEVRVHPLTDDRSRVRIDTAGTARREHGGR